MSSLRGRWVGHDDSPAPLLPPAKADEGRGGARAGLHSLKAGARAHGADYLATDSLPPAGFWVGAADGLGPAALMRSKAAFVAKSGREARASQPVFVRELTPPGRGRHGPRRTGQAPHRQRPRPLRLRQQVPALRQFGGLRSPRGERRRNSIEAGSRRASTVAAAARGVVLGRRGCVRASLASGHPSMGAPRPAGLPRQAPRRPAPLGPARGLRGPQAAHSGPSNSPRLPLGRASPTADAVGGVGASSTTRVCEPRARARLCAEVSARTSLLLQLRSPSTEVRAPGRPHGRPTVPPAVR